MRFKNLLGLLAIGGAVAYAQKKRGGDLSLAGIKSSLRDAFNNVKGQLEGMKSNVMGNQNQDRSFGASGVGGVGSNVRGTSDLGSVGGHDDIGSSTGYSQSSGYGSNDLGSTSGSIGSTTGNGLGGSGIGRKY